MRAVQDFSVKRLDFLAVLLILEVSPDLFAINSCVVSSLHSPAFQFEDCNVDPEKCLIDVAT
jgi:hypothetical protein